MAVSARPPERRTAPRGRFVSSALLLAASASLGGCLATNGLHTARTVPRGGYEVFAAPQGVAVNESSGVTGGFSSTVGVRVGLIDHVDFGAQLSALQVRLEPRIRIVSQPAFDLAIAPNAYVAWLDVESVDGFSDGFVAALGGGALLIASISPSRALSFNLVGGAEAAVLTDDGSVGLLSRQGAGIRWWMADGFALHPEVVWVADAERGFDLVDLSAGIGLVFAPGRRG